MYFPGYGWSTFDPTPGYDQTPWEYREQSNLQGGKAFGFVATKAGEAIGPALKPVGSLVRGVASLDPVSIIVVTLLVGGFSLLFIYGRRRLEKKRRRPDPQHSVRVSDVRLYSRYKEVTSAFEEAGVVREEHETPEEYARRAAEELYGPGEDQ